MLSPIEPALPQVKKPKKKKKSPTTQGPVSIPPGGTIKFGKQNPAFRALWWQARLNDSEYIGPLNILEETIEAWDEAVTYYHNKEKNSSALAAEQWSSYFKSLRSKEKKE